MESHFIYPNLNAQIKFELNQIKGFNIHINEHVTSHCITEHSIFTLKLIKKITILNYT